ncbi:DUF4430 domain-containing protein [Streptococcus cuniculipharyngis]|uniref:DUF4430 domain-containing protein n=1 Tax=Streptococcus cuniculipharyngis TaxID=1562651 RepID=A0A5C5SCP3_9STRE|nr:DUF4430 domain-containing protein [Streptococcus cuniculipharyngis]TWS98052.1 DUF4430 domain-containing protein [Streptococcus cuniculipharyngis]
MKKIFSLMLLVVTLFVGACSSQTATKSTAEPLQRVQLIVTANNHTTDEQVEAKSNQTVMDVLKANYQVKEKDGFITAIDGVEQDVEAKKYWMFKINGELAPKAADQITVKDGDKIEFYQESY